MQLITLESLTQLAGDIGRLTEGTQLTYVQCEEMLCFVERLKEKVEKRKYVIPNKSALMVQLLLCQIYLQSRLAEIEDITS